MYVLLPFFSFLLISNLFVRFNDEKSDNKEVLIKGALTFIALTAIIIESLSFFSILTSENVITFWTVIFLFLIIFNIYKTRRELESYKKLFYGVLKRIRRTRLVDKFLLISIIPFLALLAFIALSPNQNWDSYTYHLTKVFYWIANQNVEFYPTNNVRQLYLAPLAEYLILNFQLVTRTILLDNYVQLIMLVFSAYVGVLISGLLGVKNKVLVVILSISIPMAILQSITTQNDIVVSFFILTFYYYSFKIIKDRKFNIEVSVLLAITFALGILTKATFYIYAFPISLFLGMFLLYHFKMRAFILPILIILFSAILTGPFLFRNFETFGSILGPQKGSDIYLDNTNSQIRADIMVANFFKNASMHLVTENDFYNSNIEEFVVQVNEGLGISADSPETNFFSTTYDLLYIPNEDVIGNFYHFILIVMTLAIAVLNYKKLDPLPKLYLFLLILCSLLFALILKWQPWQTRLDLPLFLLFAPLIIYVFENARLNKLIHIIAIALLVNGYWLLLSLPQNQMRLENNLDGSSRESMIMYYDDAIKAKQAFETYDIQSVGMFNGSDTPEWHYLILSPDVNFRHVLFSNELEDLSREPFQYEAAIIDRIEYDRVVNKAKLFNQSDIVQQVELTKAILFIFSEETEVEYIY